MMKAKRLGMGGTADMEMETETETGRSEQLEIPRPSSCRQQSGSVTNDSVGVPHRGHAISAALESSRLVTGFVCDACHRDSLARAVLSLVSYLRRIPCWCWSSG